MFFDGLRLLVSGARQDVPVGVFSAGQVAKFDGTQLVGAAAGDVAGPASSTTNSIPTFADGTGKVLKAGNLITIPSAGQMQNVTQINGVNPTSWVKSALTAFTDNAIARYDGAGGGSGHDVQDSLVIIDDTGNVSLAANATVDGVDVSQLDSIVIPADEQRTLASSLPTIAGALNTSGTAYFVYLGKTTKAITVNRVEFLVTTAGAGAQTAEVGLFSTPSAPNRANQSLTKIVATGTVDSLTATGLKRNTNAFAQSVAAGTHLWAGIRTAMATTQPTIVGHSLDLGDARILLAAASGVLTGAGPFSGVAPGAGTTIAWQAPMLRATLD